MIDKAGPSSILKQNVLKQSTQVNHPILKSHLMKLRYCCILIAAINFSCQVSVKNNEASNFERNKEAREDSIKLAEAYALQSRISETATPVFQTDYVDEDVEEDAADDPAFWFNEQNPEASVIYGSNKKGGIYSYDLTGSTLNYYPVGEVNNIDVRSKVAIGPEVFDIIGGSNRSDNSIYLMKIDSIGALSTLGSLIIDTTFIDEVYGFCLAKTNENKVLAIANGKNGQIGAYMIDMKEGKLTFDLTYQWKLESQPEGMVVDEVNDILYVGEEQLGIWKVVLAPDTTPSLIPSSTQEQNEKIIYDIEGLSLYQMENPWHPSGVLIASIQGSFSYAVFDLSESNNYIGSFKITDSETIDGVEETDGLEIVNYAIPANYPQGILIVQDGFNTKGGEALSQNFKVVDMQEVLKLF